MLHAAGLALLLLLAMLNSTATAQPAPSRAQARDFRYGVCIRQEAGPLFDRLVGVMDDLGVDTVRRDFDWDRTQPAADTWNWAGNDAIVSSLRERGIDVQGVIAYSARWASSGNRDSGQWLDWSRAAPDVQAYCNYAATLATRYRGQVFAWEIWNEPDIDFWRGTITQFATMFNAASAAIHQAHPDALVLNGGFAFNVREPNPTFLADFTRQADLTHWNIWAYHDYHTFPQMLRRAAENRALHDATGSRSDIWINEGGFHDLLPGGEPEQAKTLVKKISTAPLLGARAYFWYNLIDDGTDPRDPEHHFGLLHHDLTPKPAFHAYRALIRELAPRRFAQRLAPPAAFPDLWGLVYRAPAGGGDDVIVLWHQGKQAQMPVCIGSDQEGGITGVFDINGQPVAAASLGSGRIITLSDWPQYIHFRGGSSPWIRNVLHLPDKLPLVGDEASRFAVTVSNPLDTPVRYTLRFSGTRAGISVDPATTAVDVPAGGGVSLEATCRSAGQPAEGDAIAIEVQAIGDSATSALLPCEPALSIPRAEPAGDGAVASDRGLKIPLLDRDAIVNLFEAEPSPRMHWQGPQDLSGSAVWAAAADALLLKVQVTDDQHAQGMSGADLWKGDSLQFALRVDDRDVQYLELTLAADDGGSIRTWVSGTPARGELAMGALDDSVGRSVSRSGTETTYELRIPWVALGLEGPPPSGFRASFLVNDNDGQGRKQWLQLSDGIGREKNADQFKLFTTR